MHWTTASSPTARHAFKFSGADTTSASASYRISLGVLQFDCTWQLQYTVRAQSLLHRKTAGLEVPPQDMTTPLGPANLQDSPARSIELSPMSSANQPHEQTLESKLPRRVLFHTGA